MILLTKIAAYERAKHVGKRTALGALGGALAGGAFGGLLGANTTIGFKKGLIGGALGGAGLGGAIGTAGGYMSMKRREANGRKLRQNDLGRLEDSYSRLIHKDQENMANQKTIANELSERIARQDDFIKQREDQYSKALSERDIAQNNHNEIVNNLNHHRSELERIWNDYDRRGHLNPDGTVKSHQQRVRETNRRNEMHAPHEDAIILNEGLLGHASRELRSRNETANRMEDNVMEGYVTRANIDSMRREALKSLQESRSKMLENQDKIDSVREERNRSISNYDAFMYRRKR